MIHPTAVIDPSAELGEEIEIGPFVYVGPHTRIGDGCKLDPHAVIHPYVTIGSGCRVHSGAVIGDLPQDLSFKDLVSYVEIGDDCVFREGVTINRGTAEGSSTRIGSGCFFMANSHVAHNCVVGNNVIMANNSPLGGYAEVGDGVFISASCNVHQFCRIGRLAMMGGGAQISKDLPPFFTARSGHDNTVNGLNVLGLRRAGLTAKQRTQLKNAYHVLYRSGKKLAEAVEALREMAEDGPVRELADFIASGKRGIVSEEARKPGADTGKGT